MAGDLSRAKLTLYGGMSNVAGSCGTVGLPICSDTWTLSTPEERGSLVVQFDARRAALATNVDPVARTVTSIALSTSATGDSANGVRGVQAVRPGAPESIPDSTKPAGLTQRLYQSRTCKISSTEVSLRMTHDAPEGLTVTLMGPTGVSVKLFENNATSANQRTRFPGVTQPVQSLAAFTGLQGAGYWSLSVANNQADNQGTLDGWEIDLGCAEPTDVPGATVYAWDPSGAPWDSLTTLATSALNVSTFDSRWTSEAGTKIDGWNNGGFYRFAVAPKGPAGARDGSAQLDYMELTLSYRRQ
jgi:subtilisin-like proprotein convertase family protein